MRAQYGSAQSKNGTVTGAKSHPATFVDNHGATARGSFKTTTVMPASSALAQGLGAMMVADMANSHLNNLNAQGTGDAFFRALENDDYVGMANAVAQLADITGLGGNIYRTLTKDDLAPMHQQMQQRADALYHNYQQTAAQNRLNPVDYAQYTTVVVREWGGDISSNNAIERKFVVKTIDYNNGSWRWQQAQNTQYGFPIQIGTTSIMPTLPISNGNWFSIVGNPATQQDLMAHNQAIVPTLADLLPKQDELAAIMLNILNDQNRNHTELINALAANGTINSGNTTTTVDNGGTAQTTFLTAPYTPQGSSQAQQTSFTIHPDGSVTATTIPRPDLAANTSQAPTRAPVGQTATAPATTAPKETATPEAPDICANNPNSLMCAEIGSMDYSDPVLPETNIDISLNPLNVFASGGVCPQPVGFDLLGSRQEFRYDSMCDVAQKARPWIIILSMLFSFTLVYYALGLGKK